MKPLFCGKKTLLRFKTLLFGCLLEKGREIKEAEVAKLLLKTGAMKERGGEREWENVFAGLPLTAIYFSAKEGRALQRREKTLEGFNEKKRGF